jgi:cytochrome d ubiquinol oxidase subunit II
MTAELYLAGLVLAALTLYALLGGADFGGGVWDLLASGPRADDQRRLIAKAIGPIWEANHVWLIAVIVLLFSCFPRAYAVIGTALHVPLTLMLLGIVLRGSAFVFRAYDTQREDVWHAWSRVFAIASVGTPFMLGVCLGATISGQIRLDATGALTPASMHAWLRPLPFATGLFVLAVFAFLAAVYLTNETDDTDLQEAFRARALAASAAVTVTAWVVALLSGSGAPILRDGLLGRWWSLPFQALTAAIGVGILAALLRRRYPLARLLSVLQVGLLMLGFGFAQYPYLIAPDLLFTTAAAPPVVLRTVATAMTGGLLLLLPAYAYLLHVFKGAQRAAPTAEPR